MQARIDSARRSKSGKTLSVQVGGVWYTSKNWDFEQMVGQEITFEPSTQTFPDGGTCQWINDYGVSGGAPTTADQAMNQAMANQPPPMGQPAPPSYTPPPATPSALAPAAAQITNAYGPAQAEVRTVAVPQTQSKDRDASIVAQALTKACTGPGDPVQDVWDRYVGFYSRYQAWNPADDSLPY